MVLPAENVSPRRMSARLRSKAENANNKYEGIFESVVQRLRGDYTAISKRLVHENTVRYLQSDGLANSAEDVAATERKVRAVQREREERKKRDMHEASFFANQENAGGSSSVERAKVPSREDAGAVSSTADRVPLHDIVEVMEVPSSSATNSLSASLSPSRPLKKWGPIINQKTTSTSTSAAKTVAPSNLREVCEDNGGEGNRSGRKFVCMHCKMILDRHVQLHRHVMQEHADQACPFCRLPAKALRKRHECAKCGEFAVNINDHLVKAHYATSTAKNALLECGRCAKRFRTLQEMHVHERSHWKGGRLFWKDKKRPQTYTCRVCAEEYASRYHRDQHFIAHFDHILKNVYERIEEMQMHDPAQVLNNQCPLCGYVMSNRKAFRNHVILRHIMWDEHLLRSLAGPEIKEEELDPIRDHIREEKAEKFKNGGWHRYTQHNGRNQQKDDRSDKRKAYDRAVEGVRNANHEPLGKTRVMLSHKPFVLPKEEHPDEDDTQASSSSRVVKQEVEECDEEREMPPTIPIPRHETPCTSAPPPLDVDPTALQI